MRRRLGCHARSKKVPRSGTSRPAVLGEPARMAPRSDNFGALGQRPTPGPGPRPFEGRAPEVWAGSPSRPQFGPRPKDARPALRCPCGSLLRKDDANAGLEPLKTVDSVPHAHGGTNMGALRGAGIERA